MMAARKKPAPAALRTIDLFTKLTPLEEAQAFATVDERARPPADRSDAGVRSSIVDTAIRWLGLDMFSEGDDVTLAISPKGHAVLTLIYGSKSGHPSKTIELRLSRAHVEKLRELLGAP